VAGGEYDGERGLGFQGAGGKLRTRHARDRQVRHQHIESLRLEMLDRLRTVARLGHLMSEIR